MDKHSLILKNNGLKVTPQRLAILSELDKKHHPSIDELSENIKKTHPNISIATIYKNLNQLIEKGIVFSFDVGDRVCFDVCTQQHIHCVCDSCKSVFHINGDIEKYSSLLKQDSGFDASFVKIVFNTKKCSKCKE